MDSERIIFDHFWGLGNGHLWEFGLPEAGPDLGNLLTPQIGHSSTELLANSRPWQRLLQELLPHTP